MRAQGSRERPNLLGAANQATEAWVGPACGNVTGPSGIRSQTTLGAAYTHVNGRSIVRRHYRRSLMGFLACAVIAVALVGGASADSQTSFADPVGDAGRSFDITSLGVSSFPGLGFVATVKRNPFWCWAGDLPLLIAIDTDQNPDTGSAYYGTEVELAWSVPSDQPLLLRADGWGFKAGPLPAGGLGWECGTTVGGYFTDTAALGITPTSGFNVVAATVSSHPDTAPDIGTFTYQPVARTPPPKLGPDRRAPHVLAYSAQAVHGKLATLKYQALDGRGKTADTIRIYRGKRLLKTIRRPLRNSNPFKLAHVTWRVPRTLRGRLRFSVRSADAAGNDSGLRWALLSIR